MAELVEMSRLALILIAHIEVSLQVDYRPICKTNANPITDVLATTSVWSDIECGRACWNTDGCLYWAVKHGTDCSLGYGVTQCSFEPGNARDLWVTYRAGVCNCPPDHVPYQSSCYQFVNMRVTWSEGQAHCESLGSSLVEIEDAMESQFVSSRSRHLLDNRIWLGATRQTGGNLTWNSGHPVQYADWGSGEPNNKDGTEACLVLNHNNGLWKDAVCELERGLVCEYHC